MQINKKLKKILCDFKHDKEQGGDFFNTLHRKFLMTFYHKRYELFVLRRFYKKGKVLNVGAGRDKLGSNVIALDYTNTEYNFVNGIPNPDIVADMHFLPFKDGTFDAVVATHVVEHSYTPALVLKEMLRVVKPNGFVCGALPNFEVGIPVWGYHRNPTHYYRFTEYDFPAWLAANGILEMSNLAQFCKMKRWLNPLSFDWALMKRI